MRQPQADRRELDAPCVLKDRPAKLTGPLLLFHGLAGQVGQRTQAIFRPLCAAFPLSLPSSPWLALQPPRLPPQQPPLDGRAFDQGQCFSPMLSDAPRNWARPAGNWPVDPIWPDIGRVSSHTPSVDAASAS